MIANAFVVFEAGVVGPRGVAHFAERGARLVDFRASDAIRFLSACESAVAIVPSKRVRSSTPNRVERGTSGVGREGASA